MLQFIKRRAAKAHTPPGTLSYVGEDKNFRPRLTLISYGPEGYEEQAVERIESLPGPPEQGVQLLNVVGVHDKQLVAELGRRLDIHPLLQEDLMNTSSRPKAEENGDAVFLCFKAARYIAGETGLAEEQISLFWRGRTVLVFQENEEDTLAPVIDRIRRGKGRVRNAGPDYLAAVLLDLAADTYSAALAALSEQVELFEEEVMRRPDRDTITRIYEVQREVLALRNSVLPLKDMLARLLRGELGELRDETEPYLRDVMDHALQAEDGVDSLHALLGGLMDMHISLSGMRMNEIMKVLTVIATIFIPLTFIVGVYGMNFAYMPELQWRYGYFLVLALMAAVAVVMLLYFRRKRWL